MKPVLQALKSALQMGAFFIALEFLMVGIITLVSGDSFTLDDAWGAFRTAFWFIIPIGLIEYGSYWYQARLYPASAADPGHLHVTQAAWERFRHGDGLRLNGAYLPFVQEGERYTITLANSWSRAGRFLVLEPVAESADALTLRLRYEGRGLLPSLYRGHSLHLHHALAAAIAAS